jgi:hypothetical protein
LWREITYDTALSQAFGIFIGTEYAPHGRTTLAVTSLSGGEKRYLNDIRSRSNAALLSNHLA